ncbi:hypothetical protein Tco_1076970, partial [Tanacetum coccineum]
MYMDEWDESPVIRDEDSEASGPASDAVNSYRTVPLHDPFDFYLFTDEAIVDFINKYDDLYETSESLEGGKAKISLNKEPEIRDSDGNAMPSSDTSEDSDSGREADEVDPHTRTFPLYDPFDCYLFNDEAIKRFISENDTSSSDTSISMDGPKKRQTSKTGSEDENRTTACQGRDENRHADFEALGSASWDGPILLAELLKGQDESEIASMFYLASVLASDWKIKMSQDERGEVFVSK